MKKNIKKKYIYIYFKNSVRHPLNFYKFVLTKKIFHFVIYYYIVSELKKVFNVDIDKVRR